MEHRFLGRKICCDPVFPQEQALTLATKQATAHAAAIAAGLGSKLGAVLSAQEGSLLRADRRGAAGAGAAVTTPVQTGNRDGVRHGDDPGRVGAVKRGGRATRWR
jgi:hypothetical protein